MGQILANQIVDNNALSGRETLLQSPPHPASVLLVEDDTETATEIMRDLTDRGYRVDVATTGLEALAAASAKQFDIMVVDRMLPELDGLSVITQLRERRVATPVLVLSALGAVDDRVMGLKAGGDDYLTKPFALVELAARIEALLRRPADTRETILRVGPLTLDLIERKARRDQREIELLPREFMILEYMMRRPSQVITRDMLLEDVWHYRFLPQTNLVDVHMGKLRHKVDIVGDAQMIQGVRGVGFMLVAPEAGTVAPSPTH